MSVISQQQLQYNYQWKALPPDDPRVTGFPDSIFLDRDQGYEVLPFLNRHCSDLDAAWKVERMIKTALPGNVRSHANILAWLRQNWSTTL